MKKIIFIVITCFCFLGLGISANNSLAFGAVSDSAFAYIIATNNYETGTLKIINKLDQDVYFSDATDSSCTGASDVNLIEKGAYWIAETKRTSKTQKTYWCVKSLAAVSSGAIYATLTD